MHIHTNFLDASFDKLFFQNENLKWLPWVGIDYTNSKNKILLIGESHYYWPSPDCKDKVDDYNFTRHVVSEQGLAHIKKDLDSRRLFRNIEKTFFNQSIVPIEKREALWSSVSYFNLVQDPMKSIQNRPSIIDYEKGWIATIKILEYLSPSIIVVLGTDNNKIKAFQNILSLDVRWVTKINRSWHKQVSKSNQLPQIEFIKHPSSFYSWSNWHNELKGILPSI